MSMNGTTPTYPPRRDRAQLEADRRLLALIAEQHHDWTVDQIRTEFAACTGRPYGSSQTVGETLKVFALGWYAAKSLRRANGSAAGQARRRERIELGITAPVAPPPALTRSQARPYQECKPRDDAAARARRMRPASIDALGPLAGLIDEAKARWRRLQRTRLPDAAAYAAVQKGGGHDAWKRGPSPYHLTYGTGEAQSA